MLYKMLIGFAALFVAVPVFTFIGILFNRLIPLFSFSNLKSNTGAFIYAHCLTGVVVVTAATALIVTGGKSIMLGIPVMMLITYFLSKEENPMWNGQEIWADIKANLPRAYVFLLLACALTAALYVSVIKNEFISVYYDYHYYAVIAKAIRNTGIESPASIYACFQPAQGTALYHYFDLWFTSLVSLLTGGSALVVLLFFVYPFFLFLIFGFFSVVFQILQPNKSLSAVLLFIFLVGGANLYFRVYEGTALMNNFGLKEFPGYYASFKLLVVYVFLGAAITNFLQRQYYSALFWLLSLCFAYSTVIPALCGGLFLTCAALIVLRRNARPFNLYWGAFLSVFTLLFCLFFDKLTSDAPRQAVKIGNINALKLLLLLAVEHGLQLVIVFVPALVVIGVSIFISRKEKKSFEGLALLLFCFFASACAIGFAVLNHRPPHIQGYTPTQMLNAPQAIYNFIPPLVIFTTAVFLAVFADFSKKGATYILYFVLAAISLYNIADNIVFSNKFLRTKDVYSQSYIKDCLKEVDANPKDCIRIAQYSRHRINWWFYDFEQMSSFMSYSDRVGGMIDISPYIDSATFGRSFFVNPENDNSPLRKLVTKGYEVNTDSFFSLGSPFFNNVDYIITEKTDTIFKIQRIMLEQVAHDVGTGESMYRVIR